MIDCWNPGGHDERAGPPRHRLGKPPRLLGVGRWLFPDAKIDGSRSFVAGLMVGPIWFSIIVAELIPALQGPEAWAFFPLIGVILAVLMFFAWLTPTPEEKRGNVGRVDVGRTPPALPHGES